MVQRAMMPKSMAFVKKILLVVSMIKKEAKTFTKNGTDKGRLSAHKVAAVWLLLGRRLDDCKW